MSPADHDTQRLSELQTLYDGFSRQISALAVDLGRASSAFDRQRIQDQHDEIVAARERVAADMTALEARRIPDPFSHPNYPAHRRAYLDALRKFHGAVNTGAFSQKADRQVGESQRLPLMGPDGIYEPLYLSVVGDPKPGDLARGSRSTALHQRRRSGDGGGQAPGRLDSRLQLADALAGGEDVAIIGAAGSGKTTLLRVIVTLLTDPDPASLDPGLARALPDPLPLPVYLPLRMFDLACTTLPDRYSRTPPSLLDYADAWARQWEDVPDLPPHFVTDHLRAGKAWLLLDALDEVADPDHRMTVRNVISSHLPSQCGASRIIVTARVAAYQDTPLTGFHVYQVDALDDEQRGGIVRRIYHGLRMPDAARKAQELQAKLATRDDLVALGSTPMMVWTAAVIHAFRGDLPEGRAALYDAYVDILLRKSVDAVDYDAKSLKPLIENVLSVEDSRLALCYAAFQTHRWQDDPARHPASGGAPERPAIAQRDLTDRVLAGFFQRQLWASTADARDRARTFVRWAAERSSLLVETPDGIRLGDHLSMQEFLAGCYAARGFADDDREGFGKWLSSSYRNTWWRDVIHFAVGYLSVQGGRAGADLLLSIADLGHTPPDKLAALELAGSACAQLAVLNPRPGWYDTIRADLAARLRADVLECPVEAPIVERHRAGLALGRLYGHCERLRNLDPRFPGPYGIPAFIAIPAGAFVMGSDESDRKNEHPAHEVHVDAYAIAELPTTNAMYRLFVDDGGYNDARFWPEAIADDRWKSGRIRDWTGAHRTEPAYWSDATWNNPGQPVVGVTWYEAMAYCRWLTEKLIEAEDIRDREAISLPTEAQWEKAVALDPERGKVRQYPWGNAWEDEMANTWQAKIGHTSLVGLFPNDVAASGLRDAAGNVNEWCWDWYDGNFYRHSPRANPSGPDSGTDRIIRGGAFTDNGRTWSRCGFRFWDYPHDRDNFLGFRCARILSS